MEAHHNHERGLECPSKQAAAGSAAGLRAVRVNQGVVVSLRVETQREEQQLWLSSERSHGAQGNVRGQRVGKARLSGQWGRSVMGETSGS